MIAIVILSLCYIVVAFLVTEKNAEQTLSGYNTMSEEERKRVDIRTYIPFFKRFHLFLGISSFIGGTMILYFINEHWGVLFTVFYPLVIYPYFIWKGKKSDNNTGLFH
ncbi:hypothetical protein CGC49_05815 [Capnocytophaga sp. H4358]|uniref:DUF3784 domain-containing protein n=1 Tax=Capnocytophaga TaxID=1016 RepID=UPI000BB1F257|nr:MULTISPECIES: DUF3784 domain-containing protein [unclassified Capnocytophaga]ATA72838.1 hypothetical protein CGC49_05815 [Capnocytophaga sp. H4358]ATA74932.1 hypothetical protein CGC52_05570 [Capnocytophaga sp. H2931]